MKPAPFEYFDPRSIGEAVSLLKEHEDEAKILAGGQSLIPLLNMRVARPEVLVDVNKVAGLDYVREVDGGLAVGALTRHRTVERSALVQSRQPLLHAATRFIGHPQIRNRGTIGGSLVHADPAAEYPAVALVLGAEIRATGPEGERTIEAEDLFVTYLTTALEPTEMVTEVRLPALSARMGWSFMEVARRHGDFALAGVAVTVTLGSGGTCSEARIALFGVGPTPLRVREAEQMVVGGKPSEKLFEQVGQKASEEIDDPLSDIHASAEFRQHLAKVLTRRALAEAVARVS
jgi:carbon-monoxide dehydrogenase medium subunit